MNKVTSEHENGPSIVSHQGNANENQPEPCPLSQKGTETGTMSCGDGGGNWRSPSGREFVSISYSQALVSCESQLSLLVTFPAIDTPAPQKSKGAHDGIVRKQQSIYTCLETVCITATRGRLHSDGRGPANPPLRTACGWLARY